MLYPDVKLAILELTSIVMDVQDNSNCLAQITIYHSVGVIEIYISKEYDRKLNTGDALLEERVVYGDDYHNETFEEEFKRVRQKLYNILKTVSI